MDNSPRGFEPHPYYSFTNGLLTNAFQPILVHVLAFPLRVHVHLSSTITYVPGNVCLSSIGLLLLTAWHLSQTLIKLPVPVIRIGVACSCHAWLILASTHIVTDYFLISLTAVDSSVGRAEDCRGVDH